MLALNRTFRSFPVSDIRQTKLQMLNWSSRFNICCFLDNQEYSASLHRYECIVGAGQMNTMLSTSSTPNTTASPEAINSPGPSLGSLRSLLQHGDWCFGHLSYDLNSELDGFKSRHADFIGFPDCFFFIPEVVLLLGDDSLSIGVFDDTHVQVFESLTRTIPADIVVRAAVNVQPRITRAAYLEAIGALRAHIIRGDCYEINYCQEFFATQALIEPLPLYLRLASESPSPFSAYYRHDDRYLLCASPERYLQKNGNILRSQPIKGTSKRIPNDPSSDEHNKKRLQESEKDKAENVMVVDLVRNDLSRVCEEGSVAVEELFGIYSFPQVHQMISTVRGHLRAGLDIVDAIAATFPMGSMTGAPKRRVMQLIDTYEAGRRGLYSGAVGYITPEGDADFNVVIRSILYNASRKYLSYQVGSGITYGSVAEDEYEECLAKAAAIQNVLRTAPPAMH